MTIPAPATESVRPDVPAPAPPGPRRHPRPLTIVTFALTLAGLTLLLLPGGAWPALGVLILATVAGVITLASRSERSQALAVLAASLATAGVLGAALVLLAQATIFPLLEQAAYAARDKAPLLEPSADALPSYPDDDAASATEPFAIDQTAFGADPAVPGQWWYVVVIDNADPTHVFAGVSFTITAVSPDESVLDTQVHTRSIEPHRTVVTGTLSAGPSEVGALKVDMSPSSFTLSGSNLVLFESQEVTSTLDADGLTTVTGEAVNVFTSDIDDATVTVVAYDSTGTAMGVASVPLGTVAEGAVVPFAVKFPMPVPTDATFEVFVQG